jgi:hypothetical protein
MPRACSSWMWHGTVQVMLIAALLGSAIIALNDVAPLKSVSEAGAFEQP